MKHPKEMTVRERMEWTLQGIRINIASLMEDCYTENGPELSTELLTISDLTYNLSILLSRAKNFDENAHEAWNRFGNDNYSNTIGITYMLFQYYESKYPNAEENFKRANTVASKIEHDAI